MTTPVTPGATSPVGPPATPGTSAVPGGLDGDAFLKLLVAQLRYQDPTKPVDSAAFMAQTAQLQMVETLQKLVDQNAAVISGQNSLSALALVGQRVSFTQGGTTSSGVVSSVRLTHGGPTLVVGSSEVPLSAVDEVSAQTAAAPRTVSAARTLSDLTAQTTTPTSAATALTKD